MQDDRNDDDDGRMLNISQHTWDRLIGAIGRLACAMARVSDQALQSPHRVSRSDLLPWLAWLQSWTPRLMRRVE